MDMTGGNYLVYSDARTAIDDLRQQLNAALDQNIEMAVTHNRLKELMTRKVAAFEHLLADMQQQRDNVRQQRDEARHWVRKMLAERDVCEARIDTFRDDAYDCFVAAEAFEAKNARLRAQLAAFVAAGRCDLEP